MHRKQNIALQRPDQPPTQQKKCEEAQNKNVIIPLIKMYAITQRK